MSEPADTVLDDITPRRGRRWPAQVLLGAALAWLVFTMSQLLLSGRWSLWILADLAPALLFLVVPVVLLLCTVPFPVPRVRMPPRSRVATVLAATISLVLGIGHAGVNWAALSPHGNNLIPAGAVKIVSWDTLYWDQSDDPDRFYAYLQEQHADVYLLQEYVVGIPRPDTLEPVDDLGRIREAFPGYYVASAGELLTVSRFPIAAQIPLPASATRPPGISYTAWPEFWTYRVLRTDLTIDGKTLSVYNLHLPDVLDLDFSPATSTFYRMIGKLDTWRQAEFQALHADLVANGNPAIVSGVTNTLPNMGDRHWFDGLHDAVSAGDSFYPVTLAFRGMSLWRMDGTFTTSGLRTDSYRLVDPQGMSTHRLQAFAVSRTGA
ncbi:hypothetical protein [Amycolatopsis pigmentata]|uniref:Endonuclease/exonuclease/phosphatase domain-containing protein n=1 Tax=Amycolatopsis pigmentata TaxID=450801 RepID=A0ABW5G4F8_9PSEU